MKVYIWLINPNDWLKGVAIIKANNFSEAAEILAREIADLNTKLEPECRLSTKTEKLHLKELTEPVGFFLQDNGFTFIK